MQINLSIVATMFNSENFIEEFYERITRSAALITKDFEIVFVNDFSPDGSYSVAKNIADVDPKVSVVDLSRNFGHHRAIMVGLQQARGERVFVVDIDLEEPPECIVDLAKELDKFGADVAFGVQPQRKGTMFERVSGAFFWKAIQWLTSMPIPANPLTARIMTRRYVDALLQHQEREIFLAGLLHITGFTQIPYEIVKGSRGQTSYSFAKRLSLSINAVTAFSSMPLMFIFYLGLCLTLISIIVGTYIFATKLFWDNTLDGWVSVMLSLWFLGGLNFIFLGIIGIYLAKVFIEVKQRPSAIIREIYRGNS